MTPSLPETRVRGSRATRELQFALAVATLVAVALFVFLIAPRREDALPLPMPRPFPASLDVLPNPVSTANVSAQRQD